MIVSKCDVPFLKKTALYYPKYHRKTNKQTEITGKNLQNNHHN